MELSRYKAVICEGTAEEVIINLLLDNHMLIFEREELIEEKPLRCRSAKTFESRYLRKSYENQISVIRVLDSHREKFKLSKAYCGKVDVINIVTAPEIEMLIIFREGKYEEYKKSGKKPSIFCKENLSIRNVKSAEFVAEYFSDINDLRDAIIQHHSKTKVQKGEYTLYDLIKV